MTDIRRRLNSANPVAIYIYRVQFGGCQGPHIVERHVIKSTTSDDDAGGLCTFEFMLCFVLSSIWLMGPAVHSLI